MEAAVAEGKVLAWTEDAKFQFLLRIVAQLKEDRAIKWDQINMPGRTTKSLQNMWTKINKAVADLEKGQANGTTPTKTPTKKATPRRARAKKSEPKVFDEEDDDDDNGDDGDDGDAFAPVTPSKKRGPGDDAFSGAKRSKMTAEVEDLTTATKEDET